MGRRCICLCIDLALVVVVSLFCLTTADGQDKSGIAPGVDLPQVIEFPEHRGPLPKDLEQFRVFQVGRFCGPNSLYLLLRLLGRTDVTYADVLRNFSVGERGVSLADVKQVADRYGLATEMRKNIVADDLASARMPIILHVSASAPGKDGAATGHFIVLTNAIVSRKNVAEVTLDGIDSNNLRPTTYSLTGLRKRMSGFALVLASDAQGHTFRTVLWAINCVLVAAIAFFGVARYARKDREARSSVARSVSTQSR